MPLALIVTSICSVYFSHTNSSSLPRSETFAEQMYFHCTDEIIQDTLCQIQLVAPLACLVVCLALGHVLFRVCHKKYIFGIIWIRVLGS